MTEDDDLAYDHAMETLRQMIGRRNAEINAEQRKPAPDPAVIERLTREQTDFARMQDTLWQADRAELDRIASEYGPLLKEHYRRSQDARRDD